MNSFCPENFFQAASNGMVSNVCVYLGKGTLHKNELKGPVLGSAAVKLLCATVPRDGCRVTCSDVSHKCEMCIILGGEQHLPKRYCHEEEN
jgi:hypothetical protein